MPYATLSDFVTKYQEDETAQLASISTGELVADRTRVDSALLDASSEIDLILGVRYQVPILAINQYLIHACCEIARKNLYPISIETVNIRYEQVIARLREIALGKATLGGDIPLAIVAKKAVLRQGMASGDRGKNAIKPNFNYS